MIFKISIVLFITLLSFFATADESGYFGKCQNVFANGTSIPFHGTLKFHKFRSKCAPEVLYSWQNFSKKDSGNFKSHPFSGYKSLYTWRTPMGTFGYGTTQIRIKLKKGVVFKWVRKDFGCNDLSDSEMKNTVLVNLPMPGHSLSDYQLCSPDVVHSWSKNTLGSKLEAMKELEYIVQNMSSKKQKYDSYGGFTKFRRHKEDEWDGYFNSKYLGNINPYFPLVMDSDTNWSMERFEANFALLGERKDDSDGKVFFNAGILQNETDHFKTAVPSYFDLSAAEIESLNH
jgi:hypothetical protein